jgi:hypothetical protein
MGEPDFSSDEQVFLRTQGIHVKSIPFEGILTNRRIILVDRLKNILPTKDIPLATIQQVETGENAIGDHVLTVTVMAGSGQTRQMVLTFSHTQGGNRARERDEWARILQESISAPYDQVQKRAAPSTQPRFEVVNSPVSSQTGATRKVPVKRVVETDAYEQPAPTPAPAARQPEMQSTGETVFCTRCGNRVSSESVFCNRCGTPIVAPVLAQRPAPQRQYVPPVTEPVYEQPAARIPQEPPRAAIPPVQPRQSAGYEVPPVERAPEPRRPAAPAPKPAKKGIFARLFSSGGKKPEAPKQQAPAPERKPRRSLMPGKKVMIAGIVVVVLIAVIGIGAVFVYPMLASGSLGSISLPGGSSSSSTGTVSAATADSIKVVETTAPTIPTEGVWISIDYIGSYRGTYGMTSDLQSLENSGARLYEVVNATGLVKVLVEKKDSSTKHALTAGIYKDGKLLKSDSTSNSYGSVSISSDVGGSTAVTSVATTAGNKTANSTVTTKQTTATAKTTTTTKTTTKST